MAATSTLTEEYIGNMYKLKWVWVSHTDGTATGTTGFVTTKAISGVCQRLVTIPAGGAAAPDADYDVYILDEDGYDILMAGGLNRHTANTEQVAASSLGVVANDKLTLSITGAGSANGGTVILYIDRRD